MEVGFLRAKKSAHSRRFGYEHFLEWSAKFHMAVIGPAVRGD